VFLPGQHKLLHFILCDQIGIDIGAHTYTVTRSIPLHIVISLIALIIMLILLGLTEEIRYALDYVVALQCRCRCRCRCVRQGGGAVGMGGSVNIIWSV
jgi:hypothetical protein